MVATAARTARFAPRTLAILVDRLLTRRASVARCAEAVRIEVADALSQRDLSDLFDQEDPSVDSDATTALMLVDRAERLLWEVDQALARVADGAYGYCIDCGSGIPLERLRALPATARCVACSRVSGLLVVDASRCVVGMLTEADLSEIDDRSGSRSRSWGSTVADLISRDVLGGSRNEPLAKAAPSGFAREGMMLPSDVVAAPARSDAAIEAEIRSRVIGELLGFDPDDIDVSVDQGIVTMAGVVAKRRKAVRLERLVGKVLGVSRVESSVTWGADTVHRGLVPRFAYFAKRREGSRSQTTSSAGAGNDKEDTSGGH